jgi:hypothetical protein
LLGLSSAPAAPASPAETAERRRRARSALRTMRIRLLLAALIVAGIAIYWWLQPA